jgi:hypothetical protein
MPPALEIAREVAAAADIRRRYLIKGLRGSGRSAMLDGVAKATSAETHLTPIVLRPGSGPDAAAVLITATAAGLEKAGVLDQRITDRLRLPEDEPGGDFDTKLDVLARALDDASDSIALFCDGPARWVPHEFADRAQAITETIFGVPSVRIVFTMPSPFKSRLGATWEARAADANREVLASLRESSLASEADAVAQLDDIDLEVTPPLALRLLVALQHFEAPISRTRRAALSKAPETLAALLLAELLAGGSPLAGAWMGLSLVRRPFDLELPALLAPTELGAQDWDVLTRCLLYEGADGFWLHDALKSAAGSRFEAEPRRAAHRRLATYYEKAFSSVDAQSASRLRLEVEAFHHAAAAGDDAIERFRPVFLDQLADLGRQLSEAGKYVPAADVFARAIRWDPTAAYVQHYHAYNLDVVGGDIVGIEAGYNEAVKLDETHSWWHSRLIRFLVTIGRIEEAFEAWRAAVASLAAGDPSDPVLFEELHAEVATLALHRGHLDLASEVLRSVPSSLRLNMPRFVALDHRYGSLSEVRNWGAFIPAEYWKERWWEHGPRLLAPTITRGRKHQLAWYPGRVVAKADSSTTIEIALLHEIDSTSGWPEIGTIELSADELAATSQGGIDSDLAVEDFVEIGYFGSEEDPVLRVARFERRPLVDPRLAPIFPPPDRFIGRG